MSEPWKSTAPLDERLKDEIEALAGECEGFEDAKLYLGDVVEDLGCTEAEALAGLKAHYGKD